MRSITSFATCCNIICAKHNLVHLCRERQWCWPDGQMMLRVPRKWCCAYRHKWKNPTLTSWIFWLGHRDSNPGNDGVRVRCLTAWRCPNIFNAVYYSRWGRICQDFFSNSFLFFKNSRKSCTDMLRIPRLSSFYVKIFRFFFKNFSKNAHILKKYDIL